MHIILVPGLWLDGSSWERVAAILADVGHHPHAVTLPGMEHATSDRSGVGLEEHVSAVVAAIDAIPEERVALVGHSAGGGVVHVAADRRPERVSRVIHVGGFPAADGESLVGGFPAEGDDLPLPPWDDFDEADLADLDDAELRRFRNRAIPSPAKLATDRVVLADTRRFEIPATVVATEFSSEQLVGWMADGHLPELARIAHLEFIDLPTGHWPQFTRPGDLARIVAERTEYTVVDEQGRLEPPAESSEIVTILGFLSYQRETLAWKTRGLDASGLAAKTAASDLTLGGLLKHMAYVEDHWFSYRPHGRERAEPWRSVDWRAEPDWEFTSAIGDSPTELRAMWEDSVLRAKALTAAVIASGGLDSLADRPAEVDRRVSLRWILAHMIEEYARHNGHADLLREALDGQVGE